MYVLCWTVFTDFYQFHVLGVIGKVDFTVRHLSSSTMAFPNTFQFSSGQPCVVNGRANGNVWSRSFIYFSCFGILLHALCSFLLVLIFLLYEWQCSAYDASPSSETTWTQRSTFPEYIVALTTIVGSVLFAVSSFLELMIVLRLVLSIVHSKLRLVGVSE